LKNRHHEIIFYYIITHIKSIIRNEKIPMYLEMFATTFDVDYTNLTILYHQHFSRITPRIKEVALMARDLGISVRRFPINWNYAYTLIRKHPDDQLQNKILNESLVATMIDFNKKYVKLSEKHPAFLKEVYNDTV